MYVYCEKITTNKNMPMFPQFKEPQILSRNSTTALLPAPQRADYKRLNTDYDEAAEHAAKFLESTYYRPQQNSTCSFLKAEY